MDADPPLPSRPAERESDGASTPVPPAVETGEFPRQKRRHRREDDPRAESAITDPDIAAISTLLATLIAKKQAPAAGEEAKAAKIFRFPKNAQAAALKPAPEDPAAPLPAKSNGASVASVAAEAGAPPPALTRPAPGPVQWRAELGERKRPLFESILYVGFVVLVAGGAFWAGEAVHGLAGSKTESKQAAGSPDAQAGPVWSDAELSLLDRALAADQAGDLGKALAGALSLRSNSGPLPGLDLYSSSLETRLGQFIEAEKKLIAAALEPNAQAWRNAEIDSQRGFNLVRERRFDRGAKSFGEAAMENPFEPAYFRNWGEALRRYGRLQEAVARFQEELLRYPAGQSELSNERQAAEFKIRLCLIEAGQDQLVKAALEEHLTGAAASGYWYFTAAAYALAHGDLAGGAGALSKAREIMPADQFDGIMGDYFFRTYSARPELASFFTEDSLLRQQRLQRSMFYFVDP